MAGTSGNAQPTPTGSINKLGKLPNLFTLTNISSGDMALDIGTVVKGGTLNVPYLSNDALVAMGLGQIKVYAYNTTTAVTLTPGITQATTLGAPGAYALQSDFINLQAFVMANVTIGTRQ